MNTTDNKMVELKIISSIEPVIIILETKQLSRMNEYQALQTIVKMTLRYKIKHTE